MSEPSLADEFARQLAEVGGDWYDFGCWATDNRDRILAALRIAEQAKQMVDYDMKAAIRAGKKAEEDARIAEIVREPIDEQARRLAQMLADWDCGCGAGVEGTHCDRAESYQSTAEATLAHVLALANEAGERERQG